MFHLVTMTLSLRPLLNQLTIKTTNLDYRKLDLDYIDPDPTIGDWGWAQRPYISEIERQYNDGDPVRIIVLKARQLGISTVTEAAFSCGRSFILVPRVWS